VGWLDGKVALVAGGGSGVGRAVVEEFLDEGASVGVLELSSEKCLAVDELGPNAHAIVGDATSVDDGEAAVAQTVAEFGRLDALIVSIGLFDYYRSLDDIPRDRLAEAFDETFRVNVLSHLVVAKAALPALRSARGSIIFTLSTSAFYPGRGGALYVASKFALRGLVAELAHELAPEVRVNGVAPGGTLGTDLRGLRSLGLDGRRLGDAPGREGELRARTPLQVALSAGDHAGAYTFLASDRARGITGTIINSDGGIGVRG
jgi:NAD(P)-dependent dehydrogenase (short-subunit alcohol dehydrogenase family)